MFEQYPVFEILIDRRPGGEYELTTQFFNVGDETIVARGPVPLHFDVDGLRDAITNRRHLVYGNLLARAVFRARSVREQFSLVVGKGTLRFRLRIRESAGELHEYDWERLGDPAQLDWQHRDDLDSEDLEDLDPEDPDDLDRGRALFADPQVLFSRFLYSLDYQRAPSAPSHDPIALIAVANPSDLHDFGRGLRRPKPIKVKEIVQAAEQALGGMHKEKLVDSGGVAGAGKPTWANLREWLGRGVDILFLVCHGYVGASESVLLLEDDDGRTAPVRSADFIDMVGRLRVRPRLVVLASCQSAGADDPDDLQLESDPGADVRWHLGPDLCRKGVPAVVAMQGNLTQTTAAPFLGKFFLGIRKHGQLDKAMTEARYELLARPDWSVPTLFMRLRNGRFRADAERTVPFDGWPQIKLKIKQGKCLPIFGPSASERLLGTKEDIAERLALKRNFPMAPHQRDQLQQVANFIQANHGRSVLVDDLRQVLTVSLADRYDTVLHDAEIELIEEYETDEGGRGEQVRDDLLNEALVAVTKHLALNPVGEPHEVLARLPFPLYLTTEPTDVLFESIKHGGREPLRSYYPWRLLNPAGEGMKIAWPKDDPLATVTGKRANPDRDHPIVYHLFGHVDMPGSPALTPDDFFEFLIGVDSPRGQAVDPDIDQTLSSTVKNALRNHLLLFVGFSTDDWEFRVLLRLLKRFESTGDIHNVAVQLDPDEDRTVAPDRARAYLKKFLAHSKMDIYWGSAETFANELKTETQELRVRKQ